MFANITVNLFAGLIVIFFGASIWVLTCMHLLPKAAEKKISLTIFVLCICSLLNAQQVRLVTGQASVNYLQQKTHGNTSIIKDIKVKVEYWSTTTTSAAQTVSFTITGVSGTIGVSPATAITNIPVGGYQVPGAKFTRTHQTEEFTLHIIFTDVPSLTQRQFFTIQLANASTVNDPAFTVNVENVTIDENPDVTKYDPAKPFWFETGTNFDLVDGVKLNNVAAGVFFHKVDNAWGQSSSNRSLFAGIYESKIVSTETNLLAYKQYITPRSAIPGQTGVRVFGYWGAPKQIKTVHNWSFFASPQWRITSGNADDGHFHLFFSIWGEVQYQEINVNTDNSSLMLVDSSIVKVTDIGSYSQIQDTSHRVGIFSHYWGVGLPIYYSDNYVKLIFNPVIGLSNQPSADESVVVYSGQPCWRPFYIAQFRLSEKFLGITITGEIRGLIKAFSPPSYTLALTKKFDLAKLLSYP